MRDQVVRICSMGAEHKVLPNVSFASGSMETLTQLVRRGRGCTLLPHLATERMRDEERPFIKPIVSPTPMREVSLAYSRGMYKKEIIEALATSIEAATPEDLKALARKKHHIVDI